MSQHETTWSYTQLIDIQCQTIFHMPHAYSHPNVRLLGICNRSNKRRRKKIEKKEGATNWQGVKLKNHLESKLPRQRQNIRISHETQFPFLFGCSFRFIPFIGGEQKYSRYRYKECWFRLKLEFFVWMQAHYDAKQV